MCFVVLLAYSFIVFVLSSPLRPLSRVASDYFSDSVVCIEILRPLRPLREIKRQSSLICGQLTFTACKKSLHLFCTLLGGEVLVSSRLGPRMKFVWNMNSQAHDNMSASHGRCENVNGMGTCTFSLACKERINALNISN